MGDAEGNGHRVMVEPNGRADVTESTPRKRRRSPGATDSEKPTPLIDCVPAHEHSYVPTDDEIKAELWRIGSGDGTESSRVSALRVLADILGMMRPAAPQLPEGMAILLDALSRGIAREED